MTFARASLALSCLAFACSDSATDPTPDPDAGGGGNDAAQVGDAGPEDAPSSRDAGPDATALGALYTFTGSGDGKIRVYAVDEGTGAWTAKGSIGAGASPSFLAMDVARSRLYAVDESGGNVLAFAFDAKAGSLAALGSPVSSQGAGPTHLSLDPTGKWVLVANYTAGSTAVLPVQADGSLGAATDVKSPGQKAHLAITNPSGGFAFVPCLGSNIVAQFTLDGVQGKLVANTPPSVSPPAGAGPRHLAFLPGEKFAFGVNELQSSVTGYSFDKATGRLAVLQTVSSLPAGFTNANTGAEIAVHPGGGFVYASNRGHDSIATFAVNAATGTLTLVGHEPTGGQTPRSFAVDPGGKYLFAANQNSGTVTGFRLDAGSGKPVALGGAPNTVPSPTFVGAWRLP